MRLDRLRDPRPRPRLQALHAARRPRAHLADEERARRPRGAAATGENIFDRKHAEVYAEYQARARQGGGDGLRRPADQRRCELFREHPEVLEHYRHRFQHVLVDEYQDTNQAQYELVRMLTADHRNVCVVGDSDQSIYRFRGADSATSCSSRKDFPDAPIVVLEQNYRSTQTILDAANSVIANNTAQGSQAALDRLRPWRSDHRYTRKTSDEHDDVADIAKS